MLGSFADNLYFFARGKLEERPVEIQPLQPLKRENDGRVVLIKRMGDTHAILTRETEQCHPSPSSLLPRMFMGGRHAPGIPFADPALRLGFTLSVDGPG